MSDTTVVQTPTAPQRPKWDNETMVGKFVALRDKIAEIDKRHKDELAPLKTALQTMEGWLLHDLLTAKADSIKTAAGTFYKAKKTSVTCNAWSKTLEYIQENEAWELLEARVNKTMYLELLKELAEKAAAKEERGEQVDPAELSVPGVVVSTELTVGVRRA